MPLGAEFHRKSNYFCLPPRLYGSCLETFRETTKIIDRATAREVGVVSVVDKRVTDVVEKQADLPSTLATTGCYVLPAEIFDALELLRPPSVANTNSPTRSMCWFGPECTSKRCRWRVIGRT